MSRGIPVPLLRPPTGVLPVTVGAGVITDAIRLPSLTGDGLALGSGLSVYPAANAAVLDSTLNGNFETNTTGWTNNAAGGVISRITTDWKFGSTPTTGACLQTVNSGAGANQGPITAALTGLTAGTTYAVGFRAKSVSGAVTLTLGIDWFTVLDVPISSATSPITLTTEWQWVGTEFSSPVLGVHAKIKIINTAATAATYRIDGVQLDIGGTLLPFDPANTRIAGQVALPLTALFTPTQGWVATAYLCGSSLNHVAFGPTGPSDAWIVVADMAGTLTVSRDEGLSIAPVEAQQFASFAQGYEAVTIGAWTAGFLRSSLNGAAITQTASAVIPASLDTGDLFSTLANDYVGLLNGTAHWQLVGKGVLTDQDAALLNSFGPRVPTVSQLQRLSPYSQATCLVTAQATDAILLPGYFS